MRKVVTAVLVVCGALGAQEIKRVTIQASPAAPAASGEGMFTEYCAVCHGAAAKGDGPAANALKKRPADLTQLARKNNGKFPQVAVMNYITGYDVVAAHGTRDMPVWGNLFRSLNPDNEAVAKLRVAGLADYIKSLQAR
jgi:mono/diheme cytochrome c family protein